VSAQSFNFDQCVIFWGAFRANRNFHPRFLDAALAEKLLSSFKGRANLFRFVSFRNRDQLDVVERASASFRRVRDLPTNVFQVLRDLRHAEL
jgi:hypothetical protein